jgi:hypothetical protein
MKLFCPEKTKLEKDDCVCKEGFFKKPVECYDSRCRFLCEGH